MRKTELKDSLRNIKKKIIPWFSIVIVVMISVGCFLGCYNYKDSLSDTVKRFYQNQKFKDIDVISNKGISEKEIEELRKVEGVVDAEAFNSINVKCTIPNETFSTVLIRCTNRVSVPLVKEGKLPKEKGEIAVTAILASNHHISVGDTITIKGNGSGGDYLLTEKFTVTGIINHPDYVKTRGGECLVADDNSFNMEKSNGYYLRAIVKADISSDIDIFSKDYNEATKPVEYAIKDKLIEIGHGHDEEIRKTAQEKLDDAKKQADDEIAKAEKKLDDAQKEYDKKIAEAEEKLNDARIKLGTYEGIVTEREALLTKAQGYLDMAGSIADNSIIAANEAMSNVDKTIEEQSNAEDEEKLTKKQKKALKTAVENGNAAIYEADQKKQELSNSFNSTLASYRNQIADAKAQLNYYEGELSAKTEEYKKARKEGADKLSEANKKLEEKKNEAKTKLDNAQDEIDNMSPTNYVVQNIRTNAGYVDVKVIVFTIKSCADCFIIMFIIVGVMVCFSNITIIIDEQKNLVGTVKSLGFFNKDVRRKYLLFGVSAVSVGIILGLGLELILQYVFARAMKDFYVAGLPSIIFNWVYAICIIVAEIFVAIIATYAACRGLLKLPVVYLISGQSVLKKLKRTSRKSKYNAPLYTRLILRNIRTDMVRVVISVVIIGISCAMIGIGFTFKYSFNGMVDNQLYHIQKYDMTISFEMNDVTESDISKLGTALLEAGTDYTKIASSNTMYRHNENQDAINVMVLDDSDHPDFLLLQDHKTKKELKIPRRGIIIMKKFSEIENLQEGDTLFLLDNELKPKAVEVKSIYFNYLGRSVIMSKEQYEIIFEKEPVYNTFYVKLNGKNFDEVSEKVKEIMPFATVTNPEKVRGKYDSLLVVYNMVVIIMTGFAILLSVFVLSNLTNIFVAGKKKELIVMRVNGFSTKQNLGYLARETILITALGFILAVVAGGIAGYFMLRVMEHDDAMLVRDFNPKAWLIAILMEFAFAGIIDAIAFRSVKKLKVTDINS